MSKTGRYQLFVGPWRDRNQPDRERSYRSHHSNNRLVELLRPYHWTISETYLCDQGPDNPANRMLGLYVIDTKTNRVIEEAEFNELLTKLVQAGK